MTTPDPVTSNPVTPGAVAAAAHGGPLLCGDPGDRLTTLAAADRAGEPLPAFCPFFGHRRPVDASGDLVGAWVLSQWWPVTFVLGGVCYPNAEVAMMAAKARLFDNRRVLEKLSTTRDPRRAKALGRQVAGFDQARWEEHAYRFVVDINVAKFSQHPELAAFLAGTAPAVLVEASPYDRVWGIGLGPDDPRAVRPAQWRGENLLGFALTEARTRLAGTSV